MPRRGDVRRQLLVLLLLAGTARADPRVTVLQRWGGTGLDHGWGLAFDGKGNLVLSGFGDEPVNLGGGVRGPKAADGVFAASYTTTGAHRWSWREPLGPSFYAGPMGVDGAGAALLVGDRGPSLFYRRVLGGKLAGSFDLPEASGLGVAASGAEVLIVGQSRAKGTGLLVAVSPAGEERWRKELPGSPIAVAAAGDGGSYIAGALGGDVYVARHGKDGAQRWRTALGRKDFDESRIQLAVGPGGELVAAYTSRPLTVARLSPAGEVVWSREVEGGLNVGGVAVGKHGEVAVTGDGRIARLDAGGRLRDELRLTALEVYPQGIAIDGKGLTCATGWFTGTLAAGTKKVTSVPDGYDVFLVCLRP